MTQGWKPWEIDAADEHVLNGLRDYLQRTGVFTRPTAPLPVLSEEEQEAAREEAFERMHRQMDMIRFG